MSEPALRHEVVGFDGSFDICFVNPYGDPHQHVLGPLDHFLIHTEEVGPLESLEAKEIVIEVPIIDDLAVQTLSILCKESNVINNPNYIDNCYSTSNHSDILPEPENYVPLLC